LLLQLISLELQLMKVLDNMRNMAKDRSSLVGSCRMSANQQNFDIGKSTQRRSKDDSEKGTLKSFTKFTAVYGDDI